MRRLAGFAERLGRAQAGWAGRDPAHPWLSRRWLRQYVASKPIREPVAWDHPLAAAVWPAEVRAGLRRLWERRDQPLAIAEALPQTTCHLDVWPMNLIARGAPGDEIVLLDWAFAGAGAVGEDVGNLIPDSVAGGWRGQDAQVRRAIAVTGAAKYCWLAPRMLQRLAGGPGFYDRRGDEQVVAGRLGMLTLVASWGRLALGEPTV